MGIDEVAADLLARPLDQFTAERNLRAKDLKQSGKAELAAEVLKLKKPAVHLWVANQVARENPEVLRKLRDVARAVAAAQTGRGGSARDLRQASDAFQSTLDAIGRPAEQRLKANRHAASEETLRRVREIFRLAALEGRSRWQALQKGALLEEPAAEQDLVAMFQASAGPAGTGRGKAAASEDDRHAARAAERAARMDAERAEQLEEVAHRLRTEAEAAAEQAMRADERARAAEEQAKDARRQAARSARTIATRQK